MISYCYLDGKIIPEKDAKISVIDIGVLRGYGAFDVMRTVRGEPFLFNEHYERTAKAARTLGVRMPLDKRGILRVITSLLAKNAARLGGEATIRVVLTGGSALSGIRFNKNAPTLYILIAPLELPRKQIYQRGAKLMTHAYRREHPEVKTLNYFDAVLLQNKLAREKAFEILYVWEGRALEASTSNFFLFRGDTLITPKEGVLKGVTRNKIIELAGKYYTVKEQDIPMRAVWTAKEAFLTATNKDVVPVTNIDGKKIGDGTVGPRTRHIMALFRECTNKC